jgi:hypothetical protein
VRVDAPRKVEEEEEGGVLVKASLMFVSKRIKELKVTNSRR